MDIQKIHQYKSVFDLIAKSVKDDDGNSIDVWYARELQGVLGYARWENFVTAVGRAIESCKTLGVSVDDHFREVTKMVQLGSGSIREVQDSMLTRYACYLIAQNGDPKKEEVAFAQSYCSKGDQALFGGLTTEQMKKRLGIKPESLPPAEDIKKVERRVA